MKMTECRLLSALMALLLAAGLAARAEENEPPAASEAVESAAPRIPSECGPLRLQPTGEDAAAYRVTSVENPDVDFAAPALFLESIFREPRMTETDRVRAIQSFPVLEQSMRDPGSVPVAPGPEMDRPETVLNNDAGEPVTVTADADRRFVIVRAPSGAYRMSARAAYSVLDREGMSDGQKIRALLSYPGRTPVEPADQSQ